MAGRNRSRGVVVQVLDATEYKGRDADITASHSFEITQPALNSIDGLHQKGDESPKVE